MNVRESMALHLADARYRYGAVRETDIREQVGMSAAQHAQTVAALLERPDAEAEAPAVVHRLRRLAEQRRAQRAALISPTGVTACYRGPRREDPSLVRQRSAGEEDQSVPGWDQGA